MRIVINDANILIDLVKIELIEPFSKLNFEIYTTDFVVEELDDEQQVPVLGLRNEQKISIIETDEDLDFQGIMNLLEGSNGLSFEDCSVWYYSKKLNGVLLTGDGKLRNKARKDGIEVRGVIYLFDEFLRQNLIGFDEAVEKIQLLSIFNDRLPQDEISKRISLWNQNQQVE